jgi:hypothetical protein
MMTFEPFAPFLPTIHSLGVLFRLLPSLLHSSLIVGIILHHPLALLLRTVVLYYLTMNINKNPNDNNRILNNNKNVVNHHNNNAAGVTAPEPQNEAIVDKLHGALNASRREPDGNHRRQAAATKESMAKNAAAMKEHLETMQESFAIYWLSKQVSKMEYKWLYYEYNRMEA